MKSVRKAWNCIRISLLGILAIPAWSAGAEPRARLEPGNEKTTEVVREALQREIYGLSTERKQLLQEAIKADDTAAQPHWLLGQVRTADGGWSNIDKAPSLPVTELAREYQAVRDTKQDDAAGNRSLADWCQRKELKEQERAHLVRSLIHNSNQIDLRQRLGQVQMNGRWVDRTAAQRVQSRQAEARQLHEQWQPILKKLALQATSRDQAKRDEAIGKVLEIRDVGVLPSLQAVFAPHSEDHQLLVVDLCEHITDPLATELLARQAVVSPSLKVRDRATKLLKTRDHIGYVPLLISAMYSPADVQLTVHRRADGRNSLRRAFWREGAEQHELVVNDVTVAAPRRMRGFDERELLLNRERELDLFQDRAAQAKVAVDMENATIERRNKRVGDVLAAATGEDLPPKADAWWKWWSEENDTYTPEKYVVSSYTSTFEPPPPTPFPPPLSSCECLVAGTPVWTDQGKVAIEKLKVGDLVLARDISTGELAYKPVLMTTIRPKKPLKLLTVVDEVLETTPGHLFWVSGEGWVRARDLEAGKVLHTATGPVAVTNVDDGRAAETYNLVVADFQTYFVGEHKLLSHDVTMRQPTRFVVPGLQPE